MPDKTGILDKIVMLSSKLHKFLFSEYIPDNLYTTDFRLLFVLTAIYTSLISQFRQAGNQEAEEDVISGRLFYINSHWPNHSIAGGVSDRILWNCRSDSRTDIYYKTLYLGLIVCYCTVVAVYLIASVIINGFVAFAASKITDDKRDRSYLEIAANEVKIAHHLHDKLKILRDTGQLNEHKLQTQNNYPKLEENGNQNPKESDKNNHGQYQDNDIQNNIQNIDHSQNKDEQNQVKNDKQETDEEMDAIIKECEKLRQTFQQDTYLYNWFIILYIIPRFETAFMLCILTFALTTYDIHPLGCLSPIGVSYNEVNETVTLSLSQNVIRYQRASIALIILLSITWFCLKLIQASLIPRYKWGIEIKKLDETESCCCCTCRCGWTISCICCCCSNKCTCCKIGCCCRYCVKEGSV